MVTQSTEISAHLDGCFPAMLVAADERTRYRFIEFFTAQIRNPGTRSVYAGAIRQFFASVNLQGKALDLKQAKPG